jgi:hypothetical protein
MNNPVYSIPARFRKTENLHILLWLLKDTCWALTLRVPGMIMIVPTLSVAILITWQTRHMKAELFHNLAVDCWIFANCIWMIGEFYHWDENIWHGYGLRQLALVPFACGLGLLAYFYLIYRKRYTGKEQLYAPAAPERIRMNQENL